MRTFDLAPCIVSPSALTMSAGFLMRRPASTISRWPTPYNIEKTGESAYRITMAVAGFGESDLDVVVQENTLVISGKQDKGAEPEVGQFLHRGIAGRAFERKFELADHIKVTGAALVNGLLHIDLVREVPEEKQPRKIAIASTQAESPKVIENKAA